jgi:hypothetical protein
MRKGKEFVKKWDPYITDAPQLSTISFFEALCLMKELHTALITMCSKELETTFTLEWELADYDCVVKELSIERRFFQHFH